MEMGQVKCIEYVLGNYNFGSPIQIKLSSALTLIASLSKTNGMRYRYFSHITCICYIHFKVEIILAVSLPKVHIPKVTSGKALSTKFLINEFFKYGSLLR